MRRALPLTSALLLAIVLTPAPSRAAGDVVVPASADTWVSPAKPTTSYGRSTTSRVDDSGAIAYVRFDVAGVPAGAAVTGATLALTGTGSQTTQVVDVYAVTGTWSETTTYRTRPALGALLARAAVGTGITAAFSVPVSGDGSVSYAVVRTTAGGDDVLATREASSSGRPRLTVSYGDVAAPAAACADGRDNDGDGAVDHPADPGCTSPDDGDEADPVTASSREPFVPYTPDSFFRKALPGGTPVSATSAQGVAYAWANELNPYPKIRGAQGVGWGMAYAEASCADPVWTVGPTGQVPSSQSHLRSVGFHAPASLWARLPTTADAPFLVLDRCGTSARPAGLSVWGSGASVSGQTVSVLAAGSFSHDTNGLDRRDPASSSTLNERSRGVIPDSMLIRADLLDRAVREGTGLGHVLEVFWVQTDTAAGFTHPMVGAESDNFGYGAEGERFRIRADVDLAARPGCTPSINPVGLALARTLQQHGAYLGDNSGSGTGIKTEQGSTYPGLHAHSLKGCMTWDDIEFLPRGWDG